MFESHSEAIYELLRYGSGIDGPRLEKLRELSLASGQSLADAIVEQELMPRPVLLAKIAQHLGYGSVMESPKTLPPEMVDQMPASLARAHGVVPWRATGRGLELLVADPFDSQVAEELTFALSCDVKLRMGDPIAIESLISQYYGDSGQAAVRLEHEAEGSVSGGSDFTAHDLVTMAGQAPVIRFVNLVLAQAVRDHASDIHFEPFEHEFRIRYRIDGVLYEMTPPAKTLAVPIASRLKVLANLDIAERRMPQDGRLKITLDGHTVDLRISTLPTQFGESVVLRLLDQSAVQLDFAALGLPCDVLAGLQQAIQRPNGIVLVTGPTGSGKTTTLYSGLRLLNTPDRKLLTIEDPVEYEIEGIMQVPLNPAAGLTFASALRAFLRQDPDVIMVGEIRDLETAQIAIQASLTGHLVLSTLHTNDAPAAITRLLDMGAEPFLLATTVEGVLAQRLVRRICPSCRSTCTPPEALLDRLEITAAERGPRQFFRGRGCGECNQTGYRGRRGIFEWLIMSEALRELVAQGAPARVIRQMAREQGMAALRDEALKAVFAGDTTVEEISQYI